MFEPVTSAVYWNIGTRLQATSSLVTRLIIGDEAKSGHNGGGRLGWPCLCLLNHTPSGKEVIADPKVHKIQILLYSYTVPICLCMAYVPVGPSSMVISCSSSSSPTFGTSGATPISSGETSSSATKFGAAEEHSSHNHC